MNLTFTVTVNEDADYIKDEIIQAAANQILNEVMRNQDHRPCICSVVKTDNYYKELVEECKRRKQKNCFMRGKQWQRK